MSMDESNGDSESSRYELINRLIKDIIENNAANFARIAHGEGTSHQPVTDNRSTKSHIECLLVPSLQSSQQRTTYLYPSEQSNRNLYEKIELMMEIKDYNEFRECVKSELSKLDMVTENDVKKKIREVFFEFNIDKRRNSTANICSKGQSCSQDSQSSQLSPIILAHHIAPELGSGTITPHAEMSQIPVKINSNNALQSQVTPELVRTPASHSKVGVNYDQIFIPKPETPEPHNVQSQPESNIEPDNNISDTIKILSAPQSEQNIRNFTALKHDAMHNVNLITQPFENYLSKKKLSVEYNHEVLRLFDMKQSQTLEYNPKEVIKLAKEDENLCEPEITSFQQSKASHVEPPAPAQSKLTITFTTEDIEFDRRRRFTSIDDDILQDYKPEVFPEFDEDTHSIGSSEMVINKDKGVKEKLKNKSKKKKNKLNQKEQ